MLLVKLIVLNFVKFSQLLSASRDLFYVDSHFDSEQTAIWMMIDFALFDFLQCAF